LSIHTTYPSHTTLSNFALPNNTDTILLISFANIIFLFGRQEMIFENGFVSYGRYCKMFHILIATWGLFGDPKFETTSQNGYGSK
jgi:hypothetical protein